MKDIFTSGPYLSTVARNKLINGILSNNINIICTIKAYKYTSIQNNSFIYYVFKTSYYF